jgi:PcfJ-like protein
MWLNTQRKYSAKAAIDYAIHEAIQVAGTHCRTRKAFEDLLWHVRARTPLLRPPRVGGRNETVGIRRIIAGLLAIASHHTDWLRSVEGWTPIGDSPMPQFGSLALHLFARFPVPIFMSSVWLRGRDAESVRQQGWYKHIGLGRNIRTADLPLRYTKRMAHLFLQAPDHFKVEMALRWGQVRGLGGSEVLARAVAATRLGRSFEHEDFWQTVLHFFVNEPALEPMHVGPIVDYLNDQRFVPQEILTEEGGFVQPGPLQPNLTMKGRTKRSLLSQVEEWHKRLRHRPKATPVHWERSDIGEFHHVENEGRDQELPRTWTIRELLSSGELYREGLAMQHCVVSYVRDCAGRRSSIWSMRIENQLRRDRVMTIEVDMKRRMISQARRRRNVRPDGRARKILERWALQEKLTIAEYL